METPSFLSRTRPNSVVPARLRDLDEPIFIPAVSATPRDDVDESPEMILGRPVLHRLAAYRAAGKIVCGDGLVLYGAEAESSTRCALQHETVCCRMILEVTCDGRAVIVPPKPVPITTTV